MTILFTIHTVFGIGIDASIGRLWKSGGNVPVVSLGYYTRKKDVSFYEWGVMLRYSGNTGSSRSVTNLYGTVGGMYAAWYVKPNALSIGFGAGSMLANKEIVIENRVTDYTDYKMIPCVFISAGMRRIFIKVSNLFITFGIKIGEM